MLSAGAAGPVDLHFNIRGVQFHIHRLHLRQHRHRGGAGVDTAAGLRLRHPLDPVDAGFKLQPGPGPVPFNNGRAVLHAAKLRFVDAGDLQLPAAALSVHGIHPQKGMGKQGAFLAAHAAPDLQDHVSAVIRVPWQQEDRQLFLQLFQFFLGFRQFVLSHFLHFLVMEQLLRLPAAAVRRLIGPVGLHHRQQFLQFPVYLTQLLCVAIHPGIA